jgi:translation initiation factor IF-3
MKNVFQKTQNQYLSLKEKKLMRNQHPRKYDKRNNHNFKVNNDIRMREIRLIDADGTQLGIKDPRDAVEIAKEKNLDLVMISEQASPPVCKIVDLNKYIYAEKKKQKEKDKKARESRIEIKEIQLRPVTQKHDLETKAKQIQKFIDKGNNRYNEKKITNDAQKSKNFC